MRRDDGDSPRDAEVVRQLERAAADDVVSAALSGGPVPGEERVEDYLAAAWGETRPDPRALRRRLGWLAAAAAVVATVLVWRGVTGDAPAQEGAGEGPSGVYLGEEELRLLHPRASADRWDYVEWSAVEGARYVLTIRDALSDEILFGPRSTQATRWDLSAEDTGDWQAVVIEVEARDGTGRSLELTQKLVRRSPR